MNYHSYRSEKITFPESKKIVLVGGCFDILHYGHIQFLEKARQAGDYLVVALEPDERIIHHKKRFSAHTQNERAHNLLALRCVDHVIALPILQGFDDYLELVKHINPHIIAITNGDPQINNKQKHADAVSAQLLIATDRIEPFSSSTIYQQKFLR